MIFTNTHMCTQPYLCCHRMVNILNIHRHQCWLYEVFSTYCITVVPNVFALLDRDLYSHSRFTNKYTFTDKSHCYLQWTYSLPQNMTKLITAPHLPTSTHQQPLQQHISAKTPFLMRNKTLTSMNSQCHTVEGQIKTIIIIPALSSPSL